MGPLNHLAVMKKAVSSVRHKISYQIDIGGLLDNIEADRHGPSHGYDWPNGVGNLMGLVEENFGQMVDLLNRGKNVDKQARRITHYFTDGLTIGQISGREFWGWKDDMIDGVCEFVWNRAKTFRSPYIWNSIDEVNKCFRCQIGRTYSVYIKDARKWFRRSWRRPWGVPIPRNVTHMTRRCVSQAAALSAGVFILVNKEI